ncbi:MAG: hypothetical protein LBP31_03470 [Holosporales bacterium]|nr:hypothetical protein [Holosporales bacterium]
MRKLLIGIVAVTGLVSSAYSSFTPTPTPSENAENEYSLTKNSSNLQQIGETLLEVQGPLISADFSKSHVCSDSSLESFSRSAPQMSFNLQTMNFDLSTMCLLTFGLPYFPILSKGTKSSENSCNPLNLDLDLKSIGGK